MTGYRRAREDKQKILRAYSLLNVTPGDSPAKIKKEYRLLARKFHPDNFSTNLAAMKNATEKMKALNEAYSLIKKAPLDKEDRFDSPKVEYEQTGYSQTEYSREQHTEYRYEATYRPPGHNSFRAYFNSTDTPELLYNSSPLRFIFGMLFGGLSPVVILRLIDTLYLIIDDVPLFPMESVITMSQVEYAVLILIGMISGIYSVLNRDRFFSFWLTFGFCAASLLMPLGLLLAAAIKILTTLPWSG